MNKKLLLTFVVMFLAVSSSYQEDPKEEDSVLVLTDSNFDEQITKHEYLLVEFYAPWCGHCKKLAPEYAKAAATLRKENIYIGKVDATVEKSTAEKFKIEGFPTLKLFVKGKPVEYTGGRTEAEIVNWMRKKTGPPSKELKTVEEVEDFKKASEVAVVYFGKPGEGFDSYVSNAKLFDDVAFAHCHEDACATHFSAESGSVVMFKNFDDGRNNLAPGFTEETFKSFIDSNSVPTVMKFDEKSAQVIFGKAIPGLFLYRDKNSENAANLDKMFNEVGAKLKGKIQAVLTGITEGLETRLAEYIGVTSADLPSVRIHDTRNDLKKYNMQGEITAENIMKFVEDWESGKLKPHLKSEEIPEKQEENGVYVLVGKAFNDVVMDPTKDVLVEFYAPWCGHCKKIAPIYDELAKKLAHNKNLVIAKMDATANETEAVSIQGFPTIKFWPAKDKTKPIDFDGDRTVEGFTKFLEKHSSNTITGKEDL